MKVNQYFIKLIAPLFLMALLTASCSKPSLYGTKQPNEPVIRYYKVPAADVFRATKEALSYRGYSLKQVDEENLSLETYWQPTIADSHYVEVFNRRDFGTVGAYYRMEVKVTPQGEGSSVSIRNVAKSLIINYKSSRRDEHRLFDKIDDFTRRRDIQVTNIGLE